MSDFDFEDVELNDDNEINPFEDEDEKRYVNKFYEAQTAFNHAMKEGLDGFAILEKYVDRGDLKVFQADQIKASHKHTSDFGVKKTIATSTKIALKGLKTLPPRQYTIKRLEIEKGSLVLLCASGGSCKSTLLQYIACCISSGSSLFGKFPVEKGTVLHLDQEQNEVQTQRKYERLAAELGLDSLDIERIVLNYRLDAPEAKNQAETDLMPYFSGKKIVLIDSLKATTQADENSPDIEPNLKMLKRLAAKTGTSVIIIHHKGKSDTGAKQSGRGHSSIYDSVDVQIDVDWSSTTYTGTLICKKNRDGKMFDGIEYKLEDTGEFNKDQNCSEGLALRLINDEVKAKKEGTPAELITSALLEKGKLNNGQLFEAVGGERATYDKAVVKLLADGFIKEEKGLKNARIFSLTADAILRINESKNEK